ncbi:MAG: cation diffusion facilitator family transporter [Clostridia bacterium]|nr:cation diffusion facilitator family transporter [Clostridia bacterium]
MDVLERERQITKTSAIGIGANVLLAGFKALVGLISGSIAVVLDAVNNLTDAMSSVITIAGVKLARQKPDMDHPYGHGRIEYFSAILISFIILAAGVMSLVESVKKIITPEMPDYSIATIVVVVAAVAVKLLLGNYVSKKGAELNSDALSNSGADAKFDALISVATLIGIGVTLIFKITVDGWLGAAIALFIIKAGIGMLMESLGDVMGKRADSEITKQIKQEIKEIPGVLGAFDLILHNYGPSKAICSVHVEVSGEDSAVDVHRITMAIQKLMREKYKFLTTVGIYAVDPKKAEERKKIHEIVMSNPGMLGTHGYFFDDEKKTVSFDAGIDFTVNDPEALKKKVVADIRKETGYTASVNFDAYFSD